MRTTTDVAVVGAGPAGCVTAIAHARQGAHVLLFEGQPGAASRLAGEWLHPSGVQVLQRLDVGPIAEASGHRAGSGFVVFPSDGSPPIVLDYPGGAVGLSCEHGALVGALRRAATEHPRIQFAPSMPVRRIEGQRLTLGGAAGAGATVLAGRIVGADGRSSVVRKSLGLPPAMTCVSYMAGLVLEDVELPYEGYGHLLLGGPGPVFVYRIGPRRLRACLDVPLHDRSLTAGPAALWDAFRPVMPAFLAGALRSALERRPVAWAANHFRPRTHYGEDRRALVGDAVGCFHPLTAVGLSLGLMDADCLARVATVEAYRSERAARTRVPQALAAALYQVFAGQDAAAAAFRRALFGLWRRDPALRERTMRLLAAQDVGIADFARPFLRVTARAAGPGWEDVGAAGQRGRLGHRLACVRESVRWLGAAAFPRVFPPRYPGAAPRLRVVQGPGHRAGADAEAGAPPRRPGECAPVPGVHPGAEASA